jgi:hypothetical protein
MSFRVFFLFSSGLNAPITVPKGTLAACQDHVSRVERLLGFKQTKYLDNPVHWESTAPKDGVSDALLCAVADAHNRWVRWLYHALGKWSEASKKGEPLSDGWWPNQFQREHEDAFRLMAGNYGKPAETEELTPEGAQTFWHGLVDIDVPPQRWTSDYYRERMEHLYEVMRGKEHEGVNFDEKPLTPKQAASVIRLFETYLDSHDLRLDVPNGYDYLASSSDGGYEWCEKCGPAHPDDADACRKKGCPIYNENKEIRWVLKDKAAGVYLGNAPDQWPTKLNRRVLRFNDRKDAEKRIANYPNRALAVVPLRRRL